MSDTPGDGKCARLDCCNEAEYYPKVLMYARKKTPPAEAVLKLPLCGECVIQTRPQDICTEKWWNKMISLLIGAGKCRPNRRLTEVVGVRIDECDNFKGEDDDGAAPV